MNLQLIQERRAATVAAMRALTECAEREDRDLSAAEATAFDGHKATLGTLEKQLERAATIAAAERSMATETPRRGFDGTFETAAREFQVTRAIAHMLDHGSVDAGRELEISAELARRSGRSPSGLFVPHEVFIERRDILTSGSGGSLVPDTHRPDLFVDRLRAALRVQQLGATVLSGLVGTQDIPRLTGSAAAYWTAEHTDTTESTPTFDSVELAPKTVGAVVEYSRRMLLNAVPSVEQLVRNDLAQVLATAIDGEAVSGPGNSNRPKGIVSQSGVHEQSLATLSWANLLNFIALVDTSSALQGALGWLTTGHAVKKLRSTVRVASTDSQMLMAEPGSLAGYPLLTSAVIPGSPTTSPIVPSTIVFGNWADLLIGYWSGVDIVINPYETSVFKKGGVLVHALQDCDVAVRHPGSFCFADDLAA